MSRIGKKPVPLPKGVTAAVTDASQELSAGGSAAMNYDAAGAVAHTRSAAADLRQAALDVAADPTVSSDIDQAAALLERAANEAEAGSWDPATTDVQSATSMIYAATAAVKATAVPAC